MSPLNSNLNQNQQEIHIQFVSFIIDEVDLTVGVEADGSVKVINKTDSNTFVLKV